MGHNAKSISIAYWNINGFGDKPTDSEFVNMLDRSSICFLSETWSDDYISIPGKRVINKCARKLKGTKGRFSGGIIAAIDDSIRNGVTCVDVKCEYGIWLKLDKRLLGFKNDIFICGVYFPPKNSPYLIKDVYRKLEEDVSSFLDKGMVITMGDMNARVGSASDTILPDKHTGYPLHTALIHSHGEYSPPERIVHDKLTDAEGKKLVSFCKHTGMLIVNGRTLGDMPGAITSFHKNGNSTVDYCIVSPEVLDHTAYFNVEPPCHLSDHALIKLKLLTDGKKNGTSKTKLHPLPKKYKWNEIGRDEFQKALKTEQCAALTSQILDTNYGQNQAGTNKLGKDLTDLIHGAAALSLKRKRHVQIRPRKRAAANPEINQLYKKLMQDIKTVGKLLLKYPNDPYLRGRYFHMKKQVKNTIARAKKEQKNAILQKIRDAEEKQPQQFWKLVNEIRKKKEAGHTLDPDIFLEHFKCLHTGKRNQHFDKCFEDKIKKLNSERQLYSSNGRSRIIRPAAKIC